MRAKEFIEELSTRTTIPLETLKVVDRSLADNGLRAKFKGRYQPDISMIDCVRLLIGCVSVTAPTRAHEDVTTIGAFTLIAAVPHCLMEDADAVKSALGVSVEEMKASCLIDVLARILTNLDEPTYGESNYERRTNVSMEVEKEGTVSLFFKCEGKDATLIFSGLRKTSMFEGIHTIHRIPSHILRWVGEMGA